MPEPESPGKVGRVDNMRERNQSEQDEPHHRYRCRYPGIHHAGSVSLPAEVLRVYVLDSEPLRYVSRTIAHFDARHDAFGRCATRGISDGWAEISDGSREISVGSREISDGWAELTDGSREISGGWAELSDG